MLKPVGSAQERKEDPAILGEVVSRLHLGKELFWSPARLEQFEHWAGHIPFAFWIVKSLRPRLLVELGTHRGNSYCAFCQAIASFGLNTRAFAIDTWLGDPHMPPEDGVLPDLRAHHDRLYGHFSSLIQMQFSQARELFKSGGVDLIHFDGTHTYDAVRNDFETWLPTLSDRAVALFHDTNVRQQDFGVCDFWKEISSQYPSFEFIHSCGLGVLLVGNDLADPIRSLAALSNEAELESCVRGLFAARGEALTLRVQMSAQEAEVAERQHNLDAYQARAALLETRLRARDAEFSNLAAEMEAIESESSQTKEQLKISLAKLAARQAELTEIEARLHARDAEFNSLAAEMQSIKSGFTHTNEELRVSLATSTARQAELTKIEARLHARDAEFDSLAAEMQSIKSGFTQTKEELNVSLATLTTRQAELTEIESKHKAREIELAQARADMEVYRAELVRLRDSIKLRENQLEATLKSRSWRITKPFRIASVMFRNVRTRAWWRLLITGRNAGTATTRHQPKPIGPESALGRDSAIEREYPVRSLPERSREIHAKLFECYVKNSAGEGTDYVTIETGIPPPTEKSDVKLIAYYLPQFHPIPENDKWWGKGFTEWHNVARAAPHFEDHYQPRLPAELGYYDLRLNDVMRRQVELAKLYGIHAFCFHFYWFGGKRLLELPIHNYLSNKSLDLKFSLCWANENWTRRWDGGKNDVLIEQNHSPQDDINFIKYISRYFSDDRYLKIEGKPILTVYRPMILPDPASTAMRWREEVRKLGYPDLYLIATNAFDFENYENIGFDALSHFPPHDAQAPDLQGSIDLSEFRSGWCIRSYRDLVAAEKRRPPPRGKIHPGIIPSWDNSPRNPATPHVMHGSSPASFREWLDDAFSRACHNPHGERFVFINAWNEWAEGAYLEPDRRYGYAYLESCSAALKAHIERQDLKTIDETPRGPRELIREPPVSSTVVSASPFVLSELSDDEWLSMLIQSVEQRIVDGVRLPAFPGQAIQVASVGSAGRSTIEEAYKFYRYVKGQLKSAHKPLKADSSVLDFGLGWGRILRCFLKDVAPAKLHGVDVRAEFIDAARACQVPGEFIKIDPRGTLPYADNSFDLVYAYSVFTHLPEDVQKLWLAEISRVLRPGAFFIATVQPPRFLDFVQNLHEEQLAEHYWYRALAEALSARPNARKILKKSGFLFLSSYNNIDFGDTVIDHKYIETHWSPYFQTIDYLDDQSQFVQAVITGRKTITC